MTGEQSSAWGVVDTIRDDVYQIKIVLARLEERSANRDLQISTTASRLEAMETRLQKLDIKLAAAMGGVALIAWGFQLLAPMIS